MCRTQEKQQQPIHQDFPCHRQIMRSHVLASVGMHVLSLWGCIPRSQNMIVIVRQRHDEKELAHTYPFNRKAPQLLSAFSKYFSLHYSHSSKALHKYECRSEIIAVELSRRRWGYISTHPLLQREPLCRPLVASEDTKNINVRPSQES